MDMPWNSPPSYLSFDINSLTKKRRWQSQAGTSRRLSINNILSHFIRYHNFSNAKSRKMSHTLNLFLTKKVSNLKNGPWCWRLMCNDIIDTPLSFKAFKYAISNHCCYKTLVSAFQAGNSSLATTLFQILSSPFKIGCGYRISSNFTFVAKNLCFETAYLYCYIYISKSHVIYP